MNEAHKSIEVMESTKLNDVKEYCILTNCMCSDVKSVM